MDVQACPVCDLLQRIPPPPPHGKVRCVRCQAQLAVASTGSIERTLALSVAALIAFLVANTLPLMGLEAVGRTASTTVLGGVQQMWSNGREITAVMVAFAAFVAPAAYIAFLLTTLIAVRRPPAPRFVGALIRAAEVLKPWSMLEVMLLGILVALVKIAELATVVPGPALFAVGALVVLFAAIGASFDPQEVWRRVRWAAPSSREKTRSAEAS
jgi:paraquat-inducible protein A